MTEQTSSDSGEEQVLSFRKRLRKFLVDSIGKLILIFLLLIAGSAAMIFHWGGFLGGPLVHASIRFMFGMESSWDSLHIDWLKKKVIIENLVIYQPEGFNKEVFFRASLAECELNMYSGTEEFNIKKLAVHDPEFIWEFNGRSDSMRRFFEYLHSGKEKKEKKYLFWPEL